MELDAVHETFTDDERALLSRHFTNLDGPVFALVNLPEVVKGALFARYSRSPKSLRRLFLDEFAAEGALGRAAEHAATAAEDVDVAKAEGLYERVFLEYGDDSVAQLGGAHLACEQASQVLTKVLEWGRLGAYLEQSTRYIPYDDRPGGRYRYHVPAEIAAHADLAERYRATLDRAFDVYAAWLEPMQAHFRDRFPKDEADSAFVYRSTIRAKACDTLRGLLPVATRTNVGIFASAQSYEQLLMRMRAHPLAEVRAYADLMLVELRTVIPAFLTRVDASERGVAWSRYLQETREATRSLAAELLAGAANELQDDVTLTDFDPDGEAKVVAAALYAASDLADEQLLDEARKLSVDDRVRVLRAYAGERRNRRHRPGRAFERTSYRFDVLCDYGAFRDLQRHRPLTLEWQRVSPAHGFELPPDVETAGALGDWESVMEDGGALHAAVAERCSPDVAQYAVPMAFRVRFVMEMNAREAMHVIELRSSPQGHPVYRRVAHEMHRLIREDAGHEAIAALMVHVDHSDVDLERLDAERRTEARRRAAADPGR
ncbi:MAG TPA: FAD-dependent thymidylate synthase [Actinomycetota bacterium]|jgi:thymidylate synthase ThyX